LRAKRLQSRVFLVLKKVVDTRSDQKPPNRRIAQKPHKIPHDWQRRGNGLYACEYGDDLSGWYSRSLLRTTDGLGHRGGLDTSFHMHYVISQI